MVVALTLSRVSISSRSLSSSVSRAPSDHRHLLHPSSSSNLRDNSNSHSVLINKFNLATRALVHKRKLSHSIQSLAEFKRTLPHIMLARTTSSSSSEVPHLLSYSNRKIYKLTKKIRNNRMRGRHQPRMAFQALARTRFCRCRIQLAIPTMTRVAFRSPRCTMRMSLRDFRLKQS